MKPLTDEQIREAYPRDSYTTKRATRGFTIIHSSERYIAQEDSLTDVLCDLMHYAATQGIDFDQAVAEAKLTWSRNTRLTYEE